MIDRQKIRFVLVKTTHPGNIGASARAIKNMGFSELALVAPKSYPHPEATARSSGAQDVLDMAKVVPTLQDAIADCNVIFGTSSRSRSLAIPLLSVRDAVVTMQEFLVAKNNIAILFGQERMGLTNEELAACHYHLFIPCNPQYPSLNLSAAVQIIAYELHAFLQHDAVAVAGQSATASSDNMERFYHHLEQSLIGLNFLDPENPRLLMRKLRRLFNRALLEENELNILRGILTAIDKNKTKR
jgi:tRNA (cytidine32/uridine32-2'-O)-methyltransferase